MHVNFRLPTDLSLRFRMIKPSRAAGRQAHSAGIRRHVFDRSLSAAYRPNKRDEFERGHRLGPRDIDRSSAGIDLQRAKVGPRSIAVMRILASPMAISFVTGAHSG
jgi:hypothetical protein